MREKHTRWKEMKRDQPTFHSCDASQRWCVHIRMHSIRCLRQLDLRIICQMCITCIENLITIKELNGERKQNGNGGKNSKILIIPYFSIYANGEWWMVIELFHFIHSNGSLIWSYCPCYSDWKVIAWTFAGERHAASINNNHKNWNRTAFMHSTQQALGFENENGMKR